MLVRFIGKALDPCGLRFFMTSHCLSLHATVLRGLVAFLGMSKFLQVCWCGPFEYKRCDVCDPEARLERDIKPITMESTTGKNECFWCPIFRERTSMEAFTRCICEMDLGGSIGGTAHLGAKAIEDKDFWRCGGCSYFWAYTRSSVDKHIARKNKRVSSNSPSSLALDDPDEKALKDVDMFGDFWKCRDCHFWSYTKAGIRKHRCKDMNADKSSETKKESLVHPYSRRPQLRARATKIIDMSGEYWKCEKCPFWAYKKGHIRRHQTNVKH